jgi:pyrimidine operon attenuation protein / uracil phosphoribosyltransferase
MEDRGTKSRVCLYSAGQLDAVIEDMVRSAAGFAAGAGRIAVVGIMRRGAPLAERIAAGVSRHLGRVPELRFDLRITRYADDLTLLYPETRLDEAPAHAALDLSDTSVIVVDDVVYHGHSMLRAVQYLAQKNAAEIRTVALVDRGATKLPVRVDVAGVRLDVAEGDVIECCVPPYEPEWGIYLAQHVTR